MSTPGGVPPTLPRSANKISPLRQFLSKSPHPASYGQQLEMLAGPRLSAGLSVGCRQLQHAMRRQVPHRPAPRKGWSHL